MDIRRKLVFTLIAALGMNLAVIFYAIFIYKQETQRTAMITDHAFRVTTQSLSVQVHFKKQVQEWKNILLRGHQQELYRKYFQQFQQQESITETQAQELLRMLDPDSKTRVITSAFIHAHQSLGIAYRKALDQFVAGRADGHIMVDRLVRGIDREPTDLIDQIVNLTSLDRTARLDRINSELKQIEYKILFFSMTLLILTVAFLSWMADRIIARPIRTATAVAHRISSGDLTGHIPSGGSDEAGQLMSALEGMQTNLSSYQEELHQQQQELEKQVVRRTQALNIANSKLARAVKAKDFFLATMSHELRTPLTTILGLTEMLNDKLYGPINAPQQKALETLDESSRHLLTLINDILDVAKVESGNMELNWDYQPVEQLIEAGMRLVHQSAMLKGHQLEYTIDPTVKLVRGDGRRLKQILVNLLGNAIKFTPRGGKIGIEVLGHPERNRLSICVSDNGIGIEPLQQQKLFSPFIQLDNEPTRRYSGTGLGLSLVRRMAELHGGEVVLASEPGKGSRFTIYLPWTEVDNQMSAHAIPAQTGPDADTGKQPVKKAVKLLLADDNPANRKMIGDFLNLNGFSVITANGGQETVALAIEHKPSIFLIDIQLTDLDGLEVTRRLRQLAPFRQTPIIALTALAMPGDREKCLLAGMDAYLSKPVGLKELKDKLLGFV